MTHNSDRPQPELDNSLFILETELVPSEPQTNRQKILQLLEEYKILEKKLDETLKNINTRKLKDKKKD